LPLYRTPAGMTLSNFKERRRASLMLTNGVPGADPVG
jgi:hypothetical protein